ncbi:MAG: hypothetical protein ACREAA_00085 [Candidatus Polarisedimenticolia bacterium]
MIRRAITRDTAEAALVFALLLMLAMAGLTAAEEQGSPQAVERILSSIAHETTPEMTRVILRADGPIDYRGGHLKGDQIILDLANVRTSLPVPVVELGAPEVTRVVIGPEITKDGERLLKIRLTGVKARSHKVTVKGNELHIDLMHRKGPHDEKGLPKIIYEDDETTA